MGQQLGLYITSETNILDDKTYHCYRYYIDLSGFLYSESGEPDHNQLTWLCLCMLLLSSIASEILYLTTYETLRQLNEWKREQIM